MLLAGAPTGAGADGAVEEPSFDGDQRNLSVGRLIASGPGSFRFDVAEVGTRFAFDEAPIDDIGFPLHGNPFITQGLIYPAGTLQDDGSGNFSGVVTGIDPETGDEISIPEFPDLVLGTWICQGTVFAQDGFNIETGPTVFTAQLYDFHEISGSFGRITLLSQGLELIDVNKDIKRAITGGTGPYRDARGQVRQTFLGTNESGGFSLRFKVIIPGATSPQVSTAQNNN